MVRDYPQIYAVDDLGGYDGGLARKPPKVRILPKLSPRPFQVALVFWLLGGGGWLDSAGAEPLQLVQLAVGDLAPPPPDAPGGATTLPLTPAPAGPTYTNEGAHGELAPEVEAVLARQIPTGVEDLRVLEKQVRVVLSKGIGATVGIELGEWSGSGVVVSRDGLVLTAGHVVGVPGEAVEFVFPDGEGATGRMLGINRQLDCGMMKITSSAGPWPYVTPAPADTLRPGDWVLALGQPGGLQPDRTPPVRLGRVLCLDAGVISTDCTLVGGDSGGPLLDLQGRLVGIHSRIGELVTSNLHVPIAAYHEDWSRLLAGEVWGGPLDAVGPVGDHPLFGLAGTDVSGASGDGGCRVTQVFSDHPAALAGILVGDVLLKFDRQPVRSTRVLGQLLRGKKPGDRVAVELLRGSRTLTIEVLLGRAQRPLPGGAPTRPRRDTRGKLQ